mmetsp:Transcript_20095/g.32554  ORF Transcript_20095/g.32554 Transcript_20095/m.32554 type:complete len:234 (-) Transcript_20095:191-892(-)
MRPWFFITSSTVCLSGFNLSSSSFFIFSAASDPSTSTRMKSGISLPPAVVVFLPFRNTMFSSAVVPLGLGLARGASKNPFLTPADFFATGASKKPFLNPLPSPPSPPPSLAEVADRPLLVVAAAAAASGADADPLEPGPPLPPLLAAATRSATFRRAFNAPSCAALSKGGGSSSLSLSSREDASVGFGTGAGAGAGVGAEAGASSSISSSTAIPRRDDATPLPSKETKSLLQA